MSEQVRDLVVVGASAGGVEALRDLVAGLPEDFAGAMLVVLHLPPGGASSLPAILDRACRLPAESARHGGKLRPGHIYTAPPDHHLLVDDGRMMLSRGPTENGHRPAIDATLRSAAQARGAGVIGVILSGSLDDGTSGLSVVKARGGLAVVQDPKEAIYPGMPASALMRVDVDLVLPAAQMGAELARRVRESVEGGDVPPLSLLDEVEARASRAEDLAVTSRPEVRDVTRPSEFACPDCQGVLFALDENGTRFRCRVGHAWTAQALFQQQSQEIEQALWAALRALEEKRDLARRMGRDAEEHGFPLVANRYRRHSEETTRAVEVLREFLVEGLTGLEDPGDEVPGEPA
ncbi:chemotaxis protein CheB [Amycolatopsis sacchari]|uniref:protein-glutamate methylesterase n=1 Tax=Amycolatopsis dongchuanensis TaxID=1070866 RepID=A0ABP8VQM5_9PSEU